MDIESSVKDLSKHNTTQKNTSFILQPTDSIQLRRSSCIFEALFMSLDSEKNSKDNNHNHNNNSNSNSNSNNNNNNNNNNNSNHNHNHNHNHNNNNNNNNNHNQYNPTGYSFSHLQIHVPSGNPT